MASSEDDLTEISFNLPNITPIPEIATPELLPQKSKEVYQKSYLRFMKWRKEQNINSFSEDVFLAYFSYLSNTIKPSTLWGNYSMLKGTINVNHNINIKQYSKLVPFIKQKSMGYRPEKSRTFTKDQIDKFLKEAPDNQYLMTKVK